MNNEKGICCDCEQEESCHYHRKKPQIKVVNCGGFTMKGALREVLKVLIKDGEHK